MIRALITLAVMSGLGVGGYFAYQKYFHKEIPVSYKTAPVKRSDLVSTVTATGSLQPFVKVLVGSQVSGTVTRWYADFNQKVEKGFVLAQLDQDRFKATLDQRNAATATAKARAEEAKAKLADATIKLTLTEQMSAQRVASSIELEVARITRDQAQAAYDGALAAITSAEADARLAGVDLDRTVIRAPIDGVVISRDIDAGQTVAASLSAPTLFTIANNLTKMRVNAAVNETDIGRIREGTKAEFRVDAYPERRFKGVVSQVRYAETIVDNVVTYTTLIDVDNEDLALRPGMTATISLEVARAENVLAVPNAALRFNPSSGEVASVDWMRPGKGKRMQPRVYVKRDGVDPQSLVEIKIEPGLTDGAVTEVKSGEIREGDNVVTEQVGGGGRRPAGPTRAPRFM